MVNKPETDPLLHGTNTRQSGTDVTTYTIYRVIHLKLTQNKYIPLQISINLLVLIVDAKWTMLHEIGMLITRAMTNIPKRYKWISCNEL